MTDTTTEADPVTPEQLYNYRFVGDHAEELNGGTPIAPNEFTGPISVKEGSNKRLNDDGLLIRLDESDPNINTMLGGQPIILEFDDDGKVTPESQQKVEDAAAQAKEAAAVEQEQRDADLEVERQQEAERAAAAAQAAAEASDTPDPSAGGATVVSTPQTGGEPVQTEPPAPAEEPTTTARSRAKTVSTTKEDAA